MRTMSLQEEKMVTEHLYLVKSIVLSTMSINESVQGFGYEDLFQTGCEALCHAAIHYQEEKGASFATFAGRVIKNHLISHCRKVVKEQTSLLYLDTPTLDDEELTFADLIPDESNHAISDLETYLLLKDVSQNYSGISRKGIEALSLKCMGHSSIDIAKHYGVKSNHVAAWITRAINKLRADKYFSCLQN